MALCKQRLLSCSNITPGKKLLQTWIRSFAAVSAQEIDDSVLSRFEAICGRNNVSTADAMREQHGHDESYHKTHFPGAVVFPTSTSQVSEIMKVCTAERIPVVPFGTGTGLEGGIVPLKGGVTVDLTKMDEIVAVHEEDFDAVVQPGVSRELLNSHCRDTGLWFPMDPGANASICGMAATSASGTNAVRYGTMRTNVINLEVVLADGTILDTAGKGRRTKKTSAGYNLTNLFVGSEGTLGLITEATVKMYPIPEAVLSAVCSFPTIKDAVDSSVMIMQCGIPIARVELLDESAIASCNRYSKTDYKVAPTLFMEFHGSDKGVEEQVAKTSELIEMNGGSNFNWTTQPEERNVLWKARHMMWYASLSRYPGSKGLSTDVCVPISNLAEAVVRASEDAKASGVHAEIVGHVGDGNFHCFIPVMADDKEHMAKVKAYSDRLARMALSLNGTCSGEHGIGMGKNHLLNEEVGDGSYGAMKLMKKTFDPLGILNPGKVFPLE